MTYAGLIELLNRLLVDAMKARNHRDVSDLLDAKALMEMNAALASSDFLEMVEAAAAYEARQPKRA